MNISDNNDTSNQDDNSRNSSDPTIFESTILPIGLIWFTTVIYVLFIIFGVIGNLTTCTVIIRRKAMHTVINYYLFSLAISDLLLLVITIPIDIQELWDVTKPGGLFYVVTSEIAYEVSMLTVTALSIERYMAICHPIKKQTISNKRVTYISLTVIWTLSVVSASCFVVIDYPRDFYKVLYPLNSTLFYFVPVIVILVLYISIGVTLMRRNVKQTVATDLRVIKLVVAVVMVFILCWGPYHCLMFMAAYDLLGLEQQTILTTVANWLYVLSTLLNPVLYNFLSKRFRDEFKAVFLSVMCKKRRNENTRPAEQQLPAPPPK